MSTDRNMTFASQEEMNQFLVDQITALAVMNAQLARFLAAVQVEVMRTSQMDVAHVLHRAMDGQRIAEANVWIRGFIKATRQLCLRDDGDALFVDTMLDSLFIPEPGTTPTAPKRAHLRLVKP